MRFCDERMDAYQMLCLKASWRISSQHECPAERVTVLLLARLHSFVSNWLSVMAPLFSLPVGLSCVQPDPCAIVGTWHVPLGPCVRLSTAWLCRWEWLELAGRTSGPWTPVGCCLCLLSASGQPVVSCPPAFAPCPQLSHYKPQSYWPDTPGMKPWKLNANCAFPLWGFIIAGTPYSSTCMYDTCVFRFVYFHF